MNSLKIVLLTIFLGSILGACEKFTEPGKDNQYTQERVMKDPAFAEGILLNGYKALPNAYNLDEEAATDDAVSNDNFSGFRRMATGEWSSKFNQFDNWATSYNAIYNLNFFLSIVDSVEWSWQSPARNALFKKRFKAEARALRGYLYYRLLVRFGGIGTDNNLLGVTIVTQPMGIEDNLNLPRSTYQTTVDQINADYDAAIAVLPEVYANKAGTADSILAYNQVFGLQNADRIQGKIVKALKARLALHVASPAFNSGLFDALKYANAAALTAPMLITQGGVAGMPVDLRIYDADTDISNTDIIWRNDYFTNNTLEAANFPPSQYGNGRINPTQNLVDAFPMKNGYPITHASSTFNAASPYANRDPRLGYFIVYNGATFKSVINTSTTSPTSDGLNIVANYSTRTGYYLAKWLRSNISMNPTSVTTARHFYTHIRFSELYLNYAEAANEAWGPTGDPNGYGFTARTIIAKIRSRAGITPDTYLTTITDQAGMRALIRNERRLELCFEGVRFWDLRRWQLDLTEKAKGVSINGTVFTPIDVENRIFPAYTTYGPIPQKEILKTPMLIQNKGW